MISYDYQLFFLDMAMLQKWCFLQSLSSNGLIIHSLYSKSLGQKEYDYMATQSLNSYFKNYLHDPTCGFLVTHEP